MLIISACLIGILLGLTFEVVVLLPVTVAGALAYAFLSQGPGAAISAIFVATVAMQAGYMMGLTGRDILAQLLTRLNIAHSNRV